MNEAKENISSASEARIYGGPLSAVHQTIDQHKIGWLISAINEDTMLQTPSGFEAERHLKLAMNDISIQRDGLVLPQVDHVSALIEFVDNWDQNSPLLIHCWAGVSRSTAGVFMALCHLNPDVDEEEIAHALRAASPTASPNLRLVQLADQMLERRGRMVDAVTMIGQGEMSMEGAVFSLPALMGDKA